jgi:hypothetical protein
MKLRLLTVLLFAFSITTFAQIGIGTITPNVASELDITSTTRGVLLPRMTQAQRTIMTAGIFPNPAFGAAETGMLVYQIAASPIVATDSPPGLYFWDGFTWIQSSQSGWLLSGNPATNPLTQFLGTTDTQPLVIRTNNVERMRILGNAVPATAGFVGIGTTTPTHKLHILSATAGAFRLVDGSQVAGRILTSDANGVATWAAAPVLPSTAWSKLGNVATATDFIGTTNAQDFVIRTNNTEKVRVLVNGNVGINIALPTAKLDVQESQANLPIIRGTNNNNTVGAVSTGILGSAFNTLLGSAGVLGVSTGGGPNEIGVLGDYNLWGAAVYGQGKGANIAADLNLRDYGVYGSLGLDPTDPTIVISGAGVYGKSLQTGATTYGMYSNGNFAVTGTKSASVPTSKGNQLVYCTESPELWFEDLGFATLTNGSTHIELDAMFLETVYIDNSKKMHVFLQEEGDSNGLFVTIDADNKGFTVTEKNNGRSNNSFSYRILAKRRFYQNQRFGVDALQPFENNLIKHKNIPVTTTDPQEMKRILDIAKEKTIKNFEASKKN